MDLRAEFDIPPSNGEVIELESAGEKEEGEIEDPLVMTGLKEESSPIFRKQQPIP